MGVEFYQKLFFASVDISLVQLLNHVWFFATPWTTARQAFLSITISRSLLKFMSIKLDHPTISSSVILFSSCLQPSPASGSSPVSQFFTSGGQSIEVSASAPALPVNIQGWFPLGSTGLISLQSKGLSRVFSKMFIDMIIWFLFICLLMWYITLINVHILKAPTSLRQTPLDHDVNPFHVLLNWVY